MALMRIGEFAKEIGVSVQRLRDRLQKEGPAEDDEDDLQQSGLQSRCFGQGPTDAVWIRDVCLLL